MTLEISSWWQFLLINSNLLIAALQLRDKWCDLSIPVVFMLGLRGLTEVVCAPHHYVKHYHNPQRVLGLHSRLRASSAGWVLVIFLLSRSLLIWTFCCKCVSSLWFSKQFSLYLQIVDTDEKGHIIVDEFQNTSRTGIYAVGDVCGKALLTPGTKSH